MLKHRTIFQAYDEICQRAGLSPTCFGTNYSAFQGKVEGSDRMLEFIMLTPGMKQKCIEVVPSGMIFDDYKKNPRFLYGHDPDMPLGAGHNVRKSTAGGLPLHIRGDMEFMPASVPIFGALAEGMYQSYLGGWMDAGSIGWNDDGPDSVEEVSQEELIKQKIRPRYSWMGGIRYLRSRLKEFSGLTLQADNGAVVQRRKALKKAAEETGQKFDEEAWEHLQQLIAEHAKDSKDKTPDGRPILTFNDDFFRGLAQGVDVDPIVDFGRVDFGEVGPETVTPAADDPEPDPEPDDDDAVDEGDEAGEEVEGTLAAIPYSIHGKVGTSEKAWSGSGARKRLAAWASSDGSGAKDKMDWPKYRKGFARYDSGNAENFGSYGFPHHDIVGGKLVTVKRGVYAAAQRIQQGLGPASDRPGMRTHIASHYHEWGEKAPWETKNGQAYERIHELLGDACEEEADGLRGVAVQLAERIYGEDRLSEEWEPRELPEGGESMWGAVADTLGAVLVDEVGDGEEADTLMDRILFEVIEGQLGDDVRHLDWYKGFVERISEAVGLSPETLSDDFTDDVLDAIQKIQEAAAEPPETPGGPDTQQALAGIQQQARELRERLDKKGGPSPTPVRLADRMKGAS